MSTRLFVIRHGQTQFNMEGRIQGWKDSPLTKAGQAQAMIVRQWISEHKLHPAAAYSSDLGRAVETARIITAKSIPLHPVTGLREISFGTLDGSLPSPDDPCQWDEAAARKYGGETMEQAIHRSLAALKQIALENTGKDVLVITHGFILNSLLELCPRLPSVNLDHFKGIENGAVIELIFTAGKLWIAGVFTPVSDWIEKNMPQKG